MDFLTVPTSGELRIPKRNKEIILKLPDSLSINQNRTEILENKTQKIILTGHQEIFYHPGILIKNQLIRLAAEKFSGTAYNLVLETDDPGFDIPSKEKNSYKSTRFSFAPDTDKDTLNICIQQIETLLHSLDNDAILSAFKNSELSSFPEKPITEIRRTFEKKILNIDI